MYSSSLDLALKIRGTGVFCDVPKLCIIIETSMSFWSFADMQVLAPPALRASCTGTDQDTHRQHCAATGAQSTFASELFLTRCLYHRQNEHIPVCKRYANMHMLHLYRSISHQVWTLFLYFNILEGDLYFYLANLERQRILDRMNKGSIMKYLMLLVCLWVFSAC